MGSRWARGLLAIAVFLAAMAPRSSTWPGTFGRPIILLEEVDAYYHLRRIELALANGLTLPSIDTYNNHPVGATVDWPPGFDLFFALVWHLLSKVLPVPLSPAAVGAVGVAVLGSVAAAAAAWLCGRWGVRAGIAAGLCLAWSPAAVAYSRIGRLDHHAVEPLCLVVLCAAYAWHRQRASPARAATLGVVIAAASLFWIGAPFFAAALAGAFALEAWIGSEPVARRAGLTYLVAAATAAVLALTTPWGRGLQVVHYALSWFQPLVFASLAVGFGVVAGSERWRVRPAGAWTLGAVAAALGAAFVLVTGADSAGRGLAFLLGTDRVAATLLESRSLADTGPGYALRWLTPVGLAVPVLWIAAALLAFRARRIAPLLAAALALGAVAVPLSALQTRFGPHLAVVSALLAGWLVARASRPLGARVAVGIVAVTLAWGVRPATLPTSAVHPYVLGGFDALVWLRRAAPPTSHFREPWRRPEYAVAAEWVWGHWITQIGQKPNVANPLGQTPENRQGVEDVARLFLAESDDDATAAAGRLGVRYLLLSSIPVTLRELAVQAGRDPERYVVKGADGSDTFLGPFFDTFHARLYLGRGAGEEGTEPVPGVRLVFESRVRIDFMGPRPAVRIFEVVPGAVLRGRCSSGSVEGRAELEETGLTYRVLAAPGPDGAYALRIPYASERTGASIPARVTVRCGDGVTAVPVAERDVIEGGDVAVQAEGDAPDGAGPTSGPSSPMPPGEGRRGVSSPGSMEAP